MLRYNHYMYTTSQTGSELLATLNMAQTTSCLNRVHAWGGWAQRGTSWAPYLRLNVLFKNVPSDVSFAKSCCGYLLPLGSGNLRACTIDAQHHTKCPNFHTSRCTPCQVFVASLCGMLSALASSNEYLYMQIYTYDSKSDTSRTHQNVCEDGK